MIYKIRVTNESLKNVKQVRKVEEAKKMAGENKITAELKPKNVMDKGDML